MAITTMDGAVAGMKPVEYFRKTGAAMEGASILHSLAYTAGSPGAMTAPAGGLNGLNLTTKSGQLPFVNPGGGQNTHLMRFAAASSVAGYSLVLADRLWENSGLVVTTTTAQTTTQPTLPARDRNGATLGEGVLVGIEVSTATTNAGAITNMVCSYTNQAGTAGRTGTIPSFPATAAAGTFIPINLAAGDNGVRTLQSWTLGTSLVSGTVHLVAYRVLAVLGLPFANTVVGTDLLSGGAQRLYDNTVPWLLVLPNAGTATTIEFGQFGYTQG